MCPNIIVHVERPPSSCQTRCTSSHSSVRHLLTVIALRTRSTRISPPPPGRLPMPASLRRESTPRNGSLLILWECQRSGGLKACRVTDGERGRRARGRPPDHPSLRPGG